MSLNKRKFYTNNVQVQERAWDDKTEDYTGMKLFDIYFANEVEKIIEELKKEIQKQINYYDECNNNSLTQKEKIKFHLLKMENVGFKEMIEKRLGK